MIQITMLKPSLPGTGETTRLAVHTHATREMNVCLLPLQLRLSLIRDILADLLESRILILRTTVHSLLSTS